MDGGDQECGREDDSSRSQSPRRAQQEVTHLAQQEVTHPSPQEVSRTAGGEGGGGEDRDLLDDDHKDVGTTGITHWVSPLAVRNCNVLKNTNLV